MASHSAFRIRINHEGYGALSTTMRIGEMPDWLAAQLKPEFEIPHDTWNFRLQAEQRVRAAQDAQIGALGASRQEISSTPAGNFTTKPIGVGRFRSTGTNSPHGKNSRKPAAESAIRLGQVLLIAMACAQACPSGGAQEVLALSGSKDARTQVQSAQPDSATLQWRRHPSYQVFALQATLPSITVEDARVLDVGGKAKISFRPSVPLPDGDIRALAEQFGVPVAVVGTFLHRFRADESVALGELAQALRTTIIDYKYLQDRWNCYHPPSGQERIKAGALQALEAGEVGKAWEMFCALPVPQPPGGLRVVAVEQTRTLPVGTNHYVAARSR